MGLFSKKPELPRYNHRSKEECIEENRLVNQYVEDSKEQAACINDEGFRLGWIHGLSNGIDKGFFLCLQETVHLEPHGKDIYHDFCRRLDDLLTAVRSRLREEGL